MNFFFFTNCLSFVCSVEFLVLFDKKTKLLWVESCEKYCRHLISTLITMTSLKIIKLMPIYVLICSLKDGQLEKIIYNYDLWQTSLANIYEKIELEKHLKLFKELKVYATSEMTLTTRGCCCSISNQLVAM